MPYKVKKVAEIGGVSVRTLHHYDQIGLLIPESITPAGYRLYTDHDLEKLQQILFLKEIGFNLSEIKTMLDNPDFNRVQAMTAHKALLIAKKLRLENIIKTVEKTIESIQGGMEMEKSAMFDAFDMSAIEEHKEKYAEEVKQKYGKEAVEESERKTSAYTKKDWARIMANWEQIYKNIVAAMDNGPSDPQVQKAVGELRQHITDHFYNCTVDIFRGLGNLYVDDDRFTANIDKHKEGLAIFLSEAMHVYCDNQAK
ncbi:MAG: MerR family transcriptional regulator [Bacilli bacterium]|nr:MerR family transcriptional regulator [Bacilli bacterium]